MIKTRNYSLKKFSKTLITKRYFTWFQDPVVKKFITFQPSTFEEFKHDVLDKMNSKRSIFFSILNNKKKHIGNIFIHDLNISNNSAYLGILIGDPKSRGKGAGEECIKAIAKYLYKKYNILNLYLGVDTRNLAAKKLYSKIGFIKISTFGKFRIKMVYRIFENKFILGTAQFGRIYGVTNFIKQKISKKETKNIINLCKEKKIMHLDTAEDYNFNLNFLKNNNSIIDTKFIIGNIKLNNLENFIKKKYSKHKIGTIYIHNPESIFSIEGLNFFKKLKNLKRKGLFSKIGISVYNIKILKKIIKKFDIDTVQLPYNVIDRRFEKIFSFLKKNNIQIYVRSIFLQGLLLDNFSNKAKNIDIKNFHKFCILKKISTLSACIDFVMQNSYIDKFIFGVHNTKQLKKILNSRIYKNIIYPNNLISRNKDLIDPRRW
tara:strand:+ start:1170 stop:2462 length:1293 start_codon:yes stop_codon:yes gene_type:complete